jgi:hypothetical protein
MTRAEMTAKIIQMSGGDDWLELFEIRAKRRQDDILYSRRQGRRWPISVLCALLEGQAGEFRAWLDVLRALDPEEFERVWQRVEPELRDIIERCQQMYQRARSAQRNGHAHS